MPGINKHSRGLSKIHVTLLILIALTAFTNISCTTRNTNNFALRSDLEANSEKRAARSALLKKIRFAIETDRDVGRNLKWGKGTDACKLETFAFGVPKTTEYEEDAFELRTKFLNETLKKPDKNQDRCTDTRQSRPMIVLSSGIQEAKNESMELNDDQLATLGVTDGRAKDGEVIIANFFHLKRFWIARIPLTKVENAYFQLEKFDLISRESIEAAQEFLPRPILDQIKRSGEDLLDWANNNLAGHTQIRLEFAEKSPVQLYEQLIKLNTTKVNQVSLRNIVLSSEAQGTLTQIGKAGYDPIQAINPLFFSINKIVSLHEKYSDMVVRQRHRVEQYLLHIGGKTKQGANAQNPNFAKIFVKYIKMSRRNWQFMTKATATEQDPAVYRTIDFTPPPLKNLTRNCTTEVITMLEAQDKSPLETAVGTLQDITFQRAYPMLLGRALDTLGLISLNHPEPALDNKMIGSNKHELFPTDPTLEEVREHFSETETCQTYFAENDWKHCKEWADVMRTQLSQ